MQGTTLIELMLSLSISLFILAALITIYLTAQSNQKAQIALSSMQESARMVTQFLNSAIHMAGYIGCAKLTESFPLKNHSSIEFNEKNKITGYHASEFSKWSVKPNSDVITIRQASRQHADLLDGMKNYSQMRISKSLRVAVGEILLISDCKNVDIFTVKRVSFSSNGVQTITTNAVLSKKYAQHAEVSRMEVNTYFISKTDRQMPDGSPIYALYVADINQRKTELVEGVNGMQIRYTQSIAGNLVDSKDVDEWSLVLGVSIQFSLSSVTELNLQKTIYTYVTLREK